MQLYTDCGGKDYLTKSGLRKLGIKKNAKDFWKESNLEKIFVQNNVPLPDNVSFKVSEWGPGGMIGGEWFVVRQDKSLEIFSKRFMDKPVYGDFGGNAYALLGNIIADYKHEKLYLRK
ncbi:MAG TPA: hypothetical protein VII99_12260 [Bacteroidia bacterium]